ncbi:MAG: hypothetical protein QXK37_03685 [Candidatus Woesearchaeota archaeon]
MGCINSIRYSLNPLNGVSIVGAPPGYLPLYSALVAYFAILFNLSTIHAMLYFSMIIAFFSIILYYLIGREIFGNELALLVPLLSFIPSQLVLKYSPFTHAIMLPIFLLFLYRLFFKDFSIKNAVFLGITIGLIGLSHAVIFTEVVIITGIFSLYKTIKFNPFDKIIRKEYSTLFNFAIVFLVAGLVSFVVALPQQYKPLFVFGGKSTYEYTHWNSRDLSTVGQQISFFFKDFLFEDILMHYNAYAIIITLFMLFGLFSLFFIKNKSNEVKFISVLFIAYIITKNHYLLTESILGMHFVPSNMYNLASPLVAILGFSMVLQLFVKNKEHIKWVIIGCVFMVLSFQTVSAYKDKDSQWNVTARNPISPHLTELQNYLLNNSKADDIILTTNELGFAINALTGRKLLTSRRAQNGAYFDMDKNSLDAAIILYGNKTDEKIKLIKKHNIKYLYWDFYWVQSEYYFDEGGKITGWFDPIILIYNVDYENILKVYNISYFRQTTWIDPALRGSLYKKLDLLFVSPTNYRTTQKPWKEDLDQYLKEVWSYSYQGEKVAVLYKIEI